MLNLFGGISRNRSGLTISLIAILLAACSQMKLKATSICIAAKKSRVCTEFERDPSRHF